MGIQFFGEFLLERGVINREHLLAALDLQSERNMRVGAVAVKLGMLTTEQVQAINDKQKNQDLQFGDLAVKLELISAKQLDEILTYQKNHHLYLGEALLELGKLDRETLSMELAAFQQEQSEYELEHVSTPAGLPCADVVKTNVDLTRKLFGRMLGLKLKVGHAQLLDSAAAPGLARFHVSIAIPVDTGPVTHYVLSVSSSLAVRIASHILKEEISLDETEVVEDSVKEFCNVVCGNSVAKLAQIGQRASIAPPMATADLPAPPSDHGVLVYPLHLTDDEADLRFFVPQA